MGVAVISRPPHNVRPMARTKLKYRLFRASNGTTSFWRWEVCLAGHSNPLESGTVYGTMDDAKTRAEVALVRVGYALESRERATDGVR